MKKISVIFPVYNVEEDIKEALDSILNQTIFDDIEVIMVDDGSTDNSKYIIEEYASNHENFYAYHKKNEGLSSARNFGLQHAKGEYIHFFDSDDLISYDAYEKLYEFAKKDNYDIITGNFLKFNSEKTWANVIEQFVFKDIREDIPNTTLLNCPNLTWDMFVWNKIFRREFLNENNISFYKENITFEDNLFSIEAYNKAKKIAITKDFIYYWRQRESGTSITQDYSLKRATDLIKIFNLVKKYLDENINEKTILEKKYLKWLIWDIPLFLDLIKKLPKENHPFIIESAAALLKLVPIEYFENINSYFKVLYQIIENQDLKNLLIYLSIDYKKNPEIPNDLDDKYKKHLNFFEDAKSEELSSYAKKVSKKDDVIIITLENYLPFIKKNKTDEIYVKIVNPNFEDVILDSKHFINDNLQIPINLINHGENILITKYKSGNIDKEFYVKTNSRKTYKFDEYDINISRGMTSYLRLTKREKNDISFLINKINFLEDKIEFLGTSNRKIEKITIKDILDLSKFTYPILEINENSDGEYEISVEIAYNEFLKAPIKKWELEIDGLYNKINVNQNYHYVNEMYIVEVKNYGNKILIEFIRYDPIKKINELKIKNKKLLKENKQLKKRNEKLKNKIKKYKERKIIRIVDKIKKINKK